MNNPLDYVTNDDLIQLGLTPDEIANAYQPSSGGVYHARGSEGTGKTLWIAHFYRDMVDNGFNPANAVGNLTFKGKYGTANGYQVLKSDDLRQYLWDMTHKPYTGKIVIVDEIDSEFPARMFPDKDQTEIALRLWHIQKLGNYFLSTSHKGNSTDLIIHLATHYFIYPFEPDWDNNILEFDIVDNLTDEISQGWIAGDVIKTMLIYGRKELTEATDSDKIRPSLLKKSKKKKESDLIVPEIDENAELEALHMFE